MWELATFGSFPYQGFSNGEVVERVKQGRIMDEPQGCASELYVLTLTFLPTVLPMLYFVFCKWTRCSFVDCINIDFSDLFSVICCFAVLGTYSGNFPK